jgi:hypothetical protein
MQHRIALLAALATAGIPATALAQVANGNFDSGFASWVVKDSSFAPALGQTCANTPYATTTRNTNRRGTAPAAGRVAQATPFIVYAPGHWTLCRHLEQMVYVPRGTQLKFAAKIGDGIYGSAYQISPATLSLLVADGKKTTALFQQSGQNIVCGNGQVPCPVYNAHAVDMSRYWGKTVRLVFRGVTSVWNGQLGGIAEPSYAYIDNIRLE